MGDVISHVRLAVVWVWEGTSSALALPQGCENSVGSAVRGFFSFKRSERPSRFDFHLFSLFPAKN